MRGKRKRGAPGQLDEAAAGDCHRTLIAVMASHANGVSISSRHCRDNCTYALEPRRQTRQRRRGDGFEVRAWRHIGWTRRRTRCTGAISTAR
jgi:hypothetical protein